MKTQDWKKRFTPTILSRGLDYYKTGCVENMDWDADTRTLCATVQGSFPYKVKIQFSTDNPPIYTMSCDCPYAEDGNKCKHMAAVWYEFSEHEDKITASASDARAGKGERPLTIKEAIEKLSESEAKTYLLECVKEDKNLRDRILLHAQPTITASQQKQWKRELENLSEMLPDQYEDEDAAYDYEQALAEFLNLRVPILLDKSLVEEAFDLICTVYEEHQAQYFDYYDMCSSDFSFFCDDYWNETIEAATPTLKQKMFAWFAERSADDLIFGVMSQAFDEDEYLTKILAVVDADLARTPLTEEYKIANLVRCRCDLMERLHIPDSEQQAYRRQFFHISAVCMAEIEWLEDKQRIDEAIALVRQFREADRDDDRLYGNKWTRRLLKLLHHANKPDEYRRELFEYVLHVNQSDLEYVHELKRLTPPKVWSSLRDEILQTDSLKWTTKYDFLCEEELYDKLFNALMTSRSPEYVWRYEKSLRTHYLFEMQDVLVALLNNEMASAGSRNHYQAIIAKLSIISAYPDGKETVARIVDTWVHTYTRRWAMLEELQDAGYDISK